MQLQSGGGTDGDVHIHGHLTAWSFRPWAVSSRGPWRSCGERVSESLGAIQPPSLGHSSKSFPSLHGPGPSFHLLPHLGDSPQFSCFSFPQGYDPRTHTLPAPWSRHSLSQAPQGLFSVPSSLLFHPPRHPLVQRLISCLSRASVSLLSLSDPLLCPGSSTCYRLLL